MSTSINTKQGTSIASTSEEELQKLSLKAGMVPKSPAGAVAIGANQDIAKMAGTPAQKASRIAPPEGEKTLAEAQRLTPPDQATMTAPEKLERMKKLGTLNTQVEGLVQGYLQQVQSSQAALALNPSTLNVVPEANRAPLEAALNEYKGALTEQQKEAAIIKAGNAVGHPLTAAELTNYFSGAPDALSNLAKNVTPGSVSLRDLHLSNAGIDIPVLARDLGVSEEELQGLSLPQLNAKVEEIKRAEYASSDEAAAASLSAVGNRGKQLEAERKGLGQSGRTGYDVQFDELQAGIKDAATVKVAGQELTIDKLLSDESLSQIISDAAISSSKLNQLRTTEPGLADFITRYKASLVQLAGDAGLVASDVVGRQAEYHDAKKGVSEHLFTSLFGTDPDILSADELNTLKTKMQNSGIWQALSSDSSLAARLEISPSATEQLKSLSKEQIGEILKATKVAEAMPILSDLAGFTPGGLLSPAQVDFVNTWKDEIKAMPPAIASDPSFQKLIKDGTITEHGASLLAESPELWDEYRKEQASIKELSHVQSEDQFLEMLTGDSSFNLSHFNDTMIALKAWASTGNKEAIASYMKLSSALTGPDGVLDMNDVKKALEGMQAAGQGINGILDGKEGISSIIKKLGTTIMKGNLVGDSKSVESLVLTYLKDDQKIDANELGKIMGELPPSKVRELLGSNWLENKDELTKVYNNNTKARLAPTMSPMIDKLKSIPGLSLSPSNGTLNGPISYNYDAAKGMSREDAVIFKNTIAQLKQEYRRASAEMLGDNSYEISIHQLEGIERFIDQANTPSVAPGHTSSTPAATGRSVAGTEFQGSSGANSNIQRSY